MSIRVLVNGAHGKMGQLTVQTLTNHPDFTVVGKTGKNDRLADEIKTSQAQVVIDFTHAGAALQNVRTIIDSGAHPVIGTTGLLKNQIEQLQTQCLKQQLGGIIAPNFSLGAVLLMKHAQSIATYFPNVEIIEMHHDGKRDNPSGTSIYAAEMLSLSRSEKKKEPKNAIETIPGSRGASHQDIPIHAIRLPGLVAHLQVIFGGVGETLTLKHDTVDRQCFMAGVMLACKKVLELKELVYGLENIL